MSRLSTAVLLCLIAVALGPAAAASSTATAQPPTTPAGETITLVYTLQEEPLAEVRAMDSVTCTIEGPAPVACEATGELVDARVQGGSRSFVFTVVAPAAPGVYTARFARAALVAVTLPLAADEGAETTFTVVASGDPLVPGGAGDVEVEDALRPARGDVRVETGGRWLASMFMASGATVAAVALARRGPGAP